MRRAWVKLFCERWLRGSIRKEPLEVRAIFTDLLAMAGDAAYGDPDVASNGIIQLADCVGFTDESISGILNIPLETWLRAKDRLSNHPDPEENRIQVAPLSHGFSIKILNWETYQSEYRRQKKYREAKKEEKSPILLKEGKKNKEGEGEGEGEEIVTSSYKESYKESYKKDMHDIVSHWNTKGIKALEERETKIREKTESKIKTWLKDYSVDEIKAAIDNYDEILESELYYFSHRWQLWEFLDRGLINFLQKNNPKINYLKSGQDYKPSQIGKYVPPRYTEEEKKLLNKIDAEYRSKLKKIMEEEGWQSEEDIDYFKIPTPEEFRRRRLKDFKHQNDMNKRERGNELL